MLAPESQASECNKWELFLSGLRCLPRWCVAASSPRAGVLAGGSGRAGRAGGTGVLLGPLLTAAPGGCRCRCRHLTSMAGCCRGQGQLQGRRVAGGTPEPKGTGLPGSLIYFTLVVTSPLWCGTGGGSAEALQAPGQIRTSAQLVKPEG